MCEMAYYIKAQREQMQFTFLACLTEKFPSAYMKKFKIL